LKGERGKDVGNKDNEGIYTEDAENTEDTKKSSERGPRSDRGLFILCMAKKKGVRRGERPYRN